MMKMEKEKERKAVLRMFESGRRVDSTAARVKVGVFGIAVRRKRED